MDRAFVSLVGTLFTTSPDMAATTPTDNAKKAAARKHERIQAWKRVYKNWDPEGAHKLVWETEPWLDTFAAASRSKDGDSLRALRCVGVVVVD